MPTRREVIAAHVRTIDELAAAAFAEHQITERFRVVNPHGTFASWRCQRPRSWVHGFDLSVEPGRLLVMGDIGHCAWEREPDMLAWARRSLDDIHYFAQKVPQEIPTREWSAEVARAWLDEEEAELVQAQDSKRLLRWHWVRGDLDRRLDENEHAFAQALWDSNWTDGGDFPDLTTFQPGFLWCRAAVRWFLEHYQGA